MKQSPVNNWPREGEHNTVTAEHLDRMELHKAKLEHVLHYTLDRDTEATVIAANQAAQTYEYNRGHRILQQSSTTLRAEIDRAREPAALDMELIKQEAREHLCMGFQSRSQCQSP
mmetsp:Transcript_27737/g.51628  ORF Transcript_27737/g.51628 Transcript_27737/m.51628 type:complete len:115 (+) Transcript_27737:194-538(+)